MNNVEKLSEIRRQVRIAIAELRTAIDLAYDLPLKRTQLMMAVMENLLEVQRLLEEEK